MTLPIDVATPIVQAQIDAAPDCSTVRVAERILGRLVIRNKRKIVLSPVESLGECYIEELVIENSKECEVEKLTFTSNKDPLKPTGIQIVWDGANGHNALNNIIRKCEFKQYQYGVIVGVAPGIGPPDDQYASAFNRFEDCLFENCGDGLLINSANAQGITTRDCVFVGNGNGVHVKLGQYSDIGSTFLFSTGEDIRIGNAVLPTILTGTYTEQSQRFLLIDGPTSSGWPVILIGCSLVGSGSPYIWENEVVPRYGDKKFAIINKGAQLILSGCVVGITGYPLYVGVGGGQTTLCEVTGSHFFTESQQDPILDFNGTMTVSGQCLLRDPAQLLPPKTVTRLSLINAQVNAIATPEEANKFLSIRHRTGPWAMGDQSGDFVAEVRLDGKTVLGYDAASGVVAMNPLLDVISPPVIDPVPPIDPP